MINEKNLGLIIKLVLILIFLILLNLIIYAIYNYYKSKRKAKITLNEQDQAYQEAKNIIEKNQKSILATILNEKLSWEESENKEILQKFHELLYGDQNFYNYQNNQLFLKLINDTNFTNLIKNNLSLIKITDSRSNQDSLISKILSILICSAYIYESNNNVTSAEIRARIEELKFIEIIIENAGYCQNIISKYYKDKKYKKIVDENKADIIAFLKIKGVSYQYKHTYLENISDFYDIFQNIVIKNKNKVKNLTNKDKIIYQQYKDAAPCLLDNLPANDTKIKENLLKSEDEEINKKSLQNSIKFNKEFLELPFEIKKEITNYLIEDNLEEFFFAIFIIHLKKGHYSNRCYQGFLEYFEGNKIEIYDTLSAIDTKIKQLTNNEVGLVDLLRGNEVLWHNYLHEYSVILTNSDEKLTYEQKILSSSLLLLKNSQIDIYNSHYKILFDMLFLYNFECKYYESRKQAINEKKEEIKKAIFYFLIDLNFSEQDLSDLLNSFAINDQNGAIENEILKYMESQELQDLRNLYQKIVKFIHELKEKFKLKSYDVTRIIQYMMSEYSKNLKNIETYLFKNLSEKLDYKKEMRDKIITFFIENTVLPKDSEVQKYFKDLDDFELEVSGVAELFENQVIEF